MRTVLTKFPDFFRVSLKFSGFPGCCANLSNEACQTSTLGKRKERSQPKGGSRHGGGYTTTTRTDSLWSLHLTASCGLKMESNVGKCRAANLPDDTGFYGRWAHMYSKTTANQQPDGRCESWIFLQHLRGLFLNNTRAVKEKVSALQHHSEKETQVNSVSQFAMLFLSGFERVNRLTI